MWPPLPNSAYFWLRWRAYYFRKRGIPPHDAATRARDELLHHNGRPLSPPDGSYVSGVWFIDEQAYSLALLATPLPPGGYSIR